MRPAGSPRRRVLPDGRAGQCVVLVLGATLRPRSAVWVCPFPTPRLSWLMGTWPPRDCEQCCRERLCGACGSSGHTAHCWPLPGTRPPGEGAGALQARPRSQALAAAQPCPPPRLGAGVGRGGGCPLSLWEGQTRGLGGRAGMTHHRDRCLYRLKVGSSVVAVSSSWVLPTEPAACESPRDRGRACRGPAR